MWHPPTIDPGSEPSPRGGLTSNDRIDICRGLFAILVVVAHGVDIACSVHPGAAEHYPWWLHRLIHYVVGAGVFWVIGFFVISGYCIQLSVGRMTVDGRFPLARYLAARLTRILPLYYVALGCAVVAESLMATVRPSFWGNGLDGRTLLGQLVVAQNMFETYGSFAPSWSITNEMFYYIFYGLIVPIALAFGVRATWLGMMFCSVVALVAEVLYFFGGFYRSPPVLGTGLLFGLGTLWFLGALVAENRILLRGSRLWRGVSRSWPIWLAAAISMWYSQRVHLQFVYVVLGVAFALMLVRFVTQDPVSSAEARGTKRGLVEMLGLASYPMYLFHGPLMMLLGSLLLRCGVVWDWTITWVLLVSAGVSLGIALGYLAERPTMRWRAALLERIAPSGRAASGVRVAIGLTGGQR